MAMLVKLMWQIIFALSSRQLESSLLDKVKLLGQQLNYQKKVLEKGAAFPEGDSSESTNLRQNQMAQQNELDMSNARLEALQEHIDQWAI